VQKEGIQISTAFLILTEQKQQRTTEKHALTKCRQDNSRNILLYSSKRRRNKRIHVCNQMYQFSQKYLLVNTTKSHTLPAGKYPVVGAMAPRQDKQVATLHNPQRRDVKNSKIIDGWGLI